jgi:hypothetical protein
LKKSTGSDFTAWISSFAGLTADHLQTGIGTQACSTPAGSLSTPQASGTPPPGVLLNISRGNIGSMEDFSLPGDLLYITHEDPVAPGEYKLAHVVMWTGKRFSDLKKGADAARYDEKRMGQPDSRLGGDMQSYLSDPVD